MVAATHPHTPTPNTPPTLHTPHTHTTLHTRPRPPTYSFSPEFTHTRTHAHTLTCSNGVCNPPLVGVCQMIAELVEYQLCNPTICTKTCFCKVGSSHTRKCFVFLRFHHVLHGDGGSNPVIPARPLWMLQFEFSCFFFQIGSLEFACNVYN